MLPHGAQPQAHDRGVTMATPQQDQDHDWDLTDPPRVLPALLLPATLLAQDALPRLLASQADTLAVRRVEGLTVYWYSFPMDWARERVRQADPQATLKRVLDLHEFMSAPVRSANDSALQAPLDRDAVARDGDQFGAVPPPRPAQGRPVQAPVTSPAMAAPPTRQPATSRRPHTGQEQFGQVQQQVQHQERSPFTQHQNAMPPETALPEALPEPAAPSPPRRPSSARPPVAAPDTVRPRRAFAVSVGLAEQAQA